MNYLSKFFPTPLPQFTCRFVGERKRRLCRILSLLAVSTMMIFPAGLKAQNMGPNPGPIPQGVAAPGGMYRSFNGLQHLNLEVNMKLGAVRDEWHKTGRESACFFPPLNTVHDLAVGSTSLAVSKDAKKEYGKACESVLNGKNEEAEKHLRKAIELFPKYAASWVLLGQIFEQRSSLPEAQDACNKAVEADDHYLQAYVCLADIEGRKGNWQEVLNQTGRALTLDPTSNASPYIYRCAANLSLRKLPEAEESALNAQAIQIKAQEKDARLHILLAQIYDAKGEAKKEADQLREVLKMVSDPQSKAVITQALAELENQKQ